MKSTFYKYGCLKFPAQHCSLWHCDSRKHGIRTIWKCQQLLFITSSNLRSCKDFPQNLQRVTIFSNCQNISTKKQPSKRHRTSSCFVFHYNCLNGYYLGQWYTLVQLEKGEKCSHKTFLHSVYIIMIWSRPCFQKQFLLSFNSFFLQLLRKKQLTNLKKPVVSHRNLLILQAALTPDIDLQTIRLRAGTFILKMLRPRESSN